MYGKFHTPLRMVQVWLAIFLLKIFIQPKKHCLNKKIMFSSKNELIKTALAAKRENCILSYYFNDAIDKVTITDSHCHHHYVLI